MRGRAVEARKSFGTSAVTADAANPGLNGLRRATRGTCAHAASVAVSPRKQDTRGQATLHRALEARTRTHDHGETRLLNAPRATDGERRSEHGAEGRKGTRR